MCSYAKGIKSLAGSLALPGAMGERRQVGSDKTADGQEQKRRVVVRGLLQSERIAGA
jgi:hypothetical protein